MIGRRFPAILAGLFLAVGLVGLTRPAPAQEPAVVQWIWSNEGNPAQSFPAETRFFRRVFEVNRPVDKVVDEADLDITADNAFTVWVNGKEIGTANEWQRVHRFDVRKHIVHGNNVIAVEASNESPGPAGLMVKLSYVPNGMSKLALVSDGQWKASKTADKDWQKADFDDKSWKAVKELGPVGKTAPWNVVAGGGKPPGPDRFTVPDGFKVETVIPPNPEGYSPKDSQGKPLPFSLVNMTFDAKGRLLASLERGPILLCTEPDKAGVLQSIKPYCEAIKNCHGMCWVKDALLLVGDGPEGTGLYRVRDKDGDDKTDETTLLHKFKGGMGEHGPHAILHGPDGWLYLVVGNHAWAQPEKLADNSPLRRWPTGGFGPDQGKPNTTEDVLLPRLNDSRGHAANILAPGGTIWRLDHEGKNMSLVNAGFRNHFDAAFNPAGELFTFDSDMEWDEALPWYRAVRVCHCTPGADFVWRTGAANTPDYYLDSLPPTVETGRGSPVGVEFYDHYAFPEKYHGAFFMADWSIGVIYAVHLELSGASYKAKSEKFCTGAPMNVTDTAVGPKGELYFTLGGRGTSGGVYRVVAQIPLERKNTESAQPLAAWAKAATQRGLEEAVKKDGKEKVQSQLAKQLLPGKDDIIKAASRDPNYLLTIMQMHGLPPGPDLLKGLLRDKTAFIRAQAVWLIGVNGYAEVKDDLLKALKDDDALVRRRACEALIRAGIEPPVKDLVPLLADKDQFVRTAARLVLQRIDPEKWAKVLVGEAKISIAYEAIVALCKEHQANKYADVIWQRLHDASPDKEDADGLLNHLRCAQLALIHTTERGDPVRGLAADCQEMFPHKDARVNRELAILLTEFARTKLLDARDVVAKLTKALIKEKDDRPQQIHYFYCLRLIKDGWDHESKPAILFWYDRTKTWTGGHSFTPFLENIFREHLDVWTVEERKQLLAIAPDHPQAALVLAQKLQIDKQTDLLPDLQWLQKRLDGVKGIHRDKEFKQAIGDAVVKTALAVGNKPETWSSLVKGLDSENPVIRFEVIDALKASAVKPKAEDAAPFRAALLATQKLDEKSRWKGVELLRHWTNDKQFGAEKGDWKKELPAWARWFAQTFPKEPALPITFEDKPAESKYKFDDLLAFLEKDPAGQKGNVAKGKAVFEKGQCIKCHKFGKEGEGIGPDLTTVSKRFKRADMLESLLYPSKVISDQYRSTAVVTTKGQQFTGLMAVQGGTVVILQQDATKVTLKEEDIAEKFASLVSGMPEQLLDKLTKEEIADLIAYLETEPK